MAGRLGFPDSMRTPDAKPASFGHIEAFSAGMEHVQLAIWRLSMQHRVSFHGGRGVRITSQDRQSLQHALVFLGARLERLNEQP